MSSPFAPTPRITAVCITRQLQVRTAGSRHQTGIDKGPVDAIEVSADGAEGDSVLDAEHHGTIDMALYAYADEDAAWWADRLDLEIPPGRFGENLRTSGLDLSGAVIGERWQVDGEIDLEVTSPRVPCATFRHHMGDRVGWVKEFAQANRTGVYLRVRTGGTLTEDMTVIVTRRPAHGVTIAEWFAAQDDAGLARRLLDGQDDTWQLPEALRWSVDRALASGG